MLRDKVDAIETPPTKNPQRFVTLVLYGTPRSNIGYVGAPRPGKLGSISGFQHILRP